MDQIAGLLPLLLILAIFWLLVMRPARRRQQEVAELQGSLSIGAQVMTASGLQARVVGIDDFTVLLEAAPGVVLTFDRRAVSRVLAPAQGSGGLGVPGAPDDLGTQDSAPEPSQGWGAGEREDRSGDGRG